MTAVTSSTVAPANTGFRSEHGRTLGQGTEGHLIGGTTQVPLTNPCCNASIVVDDEVSNVRAITIQLKDANGADLAYVETVHAYVFTDATRVAFVATGGSTGIAIGTDGAALALVAKKAFILTSESDGDIDLTFTDTGTEQVALALYLPNGNVVTTAAFANT